ncbi:protein involved in oxidation of intracellular sulfur [Haemophilus parahaemolyticus]|uniref:Protein involved in oxidation of intracellular sulfur n=1 Tax=Haemophilus parahaemolyticus TaxID=735 RepID=A0A377HZC7_HAEPH|nr:sulfurtransferase complex subunit TusB [Haemophilus parahaemolyticus]STO63636.1 protein involved in oxidation of intracellular sulfur [Haemophilus parahaemolyticus]
MLYTLSKAQYDKQELSTLLAQLQPTDALLLWQDGVLQAVKNPQLFANRENVFALTQDLQARNLTVTVETISLEQAVRLTEEFYPQVSL